MSAGRTGPVTRNCHLVETKIWDPDHFESQRALKIENRSHLGHEAIRKTPRW